MYVQKPVAFDSINYLVGFPGQSRYSCDPFSWNAAVGGCPAPPVAVGRELAPVSDATSMALAVLQAQNKVPVRLGGNGGGRDYHRRGLTGQAGRDYHRRALSGCGCGGSCGGCGCGAKNPMGLGFAWTDVMSWIETNWLALLIGGGAVWFFKRR